MTTPPSNKHGNYMLIFTNYVEESVEDFLHSLIIVAKSYRFEAHIAWLRYSPESTRRWLDYDELNNEWLTVYTTYSDLNIGINDGIVPCPYQASSPFYHNMPFVHAWPYLMSIVIVLIIAITACVLIRLYKRKVSFKALLAKEHASITKRVTEEIQRNTQSQGYSGELLMPAYDLEWEMADGVLTIKEKLGAGAFGAVYHGLLSGEAPCNKMRKIRIASQLYIDCEVAVKMLPDYADQSMRQDFLEEIRVMKDVACHQHLVNLLGCVTRHEPLCAVLEYCDNGSLLKLVRQTKELIASDDCNIDSKRNEMVSFSWHIADGMAYFTSRGYVHRDLAARNVLVLTDASGHKIAKVADFGLCRHVERDVYTTRGGRLPIKWMAIEALKDGEFSMKTDVWSFAVTLWEMYTLGRTPLADVEPCNVLKQLESGYRLEKPDLCPDEIYANMLKCWSVAANDRPSFDELRQSIYMMDAMIADNYYQLAASPIQEVYQPNFDVNHKSIFSASFRKLSAIQIESDKNTMHEKDKMQNEQKATNREPTIIEESNV